MLRGRTPAARGQQALDRDQEVHRLTARLRALRRFGLDLCLGHMVGADGSGAGLRRTARPQGPRRSPAPGRLALPGRRAVLRQRPTPTRWAWSVAAGTAGPGAGSATTGTRCSPRTGSSGHAAVLDDQSAFIASLGSSRSPRMRDVLATIQADQDAIIRAGSRGALVVDGGPGTGKTVVALHRTAYLLYADPRLGHRRGGVLFVGPHQPFLAYVGDVLPSLGEEGVQTCTLRDLVPEGAVAVARGGPGRGRAEVVRGHGRRHRAGGPALRGTARARGCGRDAVVRPLAQRRRVGGSVRLAGPRHAAQRGPRRGLGRGARRSWSTRSTTRTCPQTSSAGRSQRPRGAARRVRSRRGRSSSPPIWWGTCGRCRPTCGGARPGWGPDEVRALQRA